MNAGLHPAFDPAGGVEPAKAVPAMATGCFSEQPVAPVLRSIFACCWVHRIPTTGAPPVIVMPDGTIDLQWLDGTFRIAGPDKEPQIELLPAGSMVIGFRFLPAAAAAWLGVPAGEMVGRRLALDELWGARARQLTGAIRARGDLTGLVTSLEHVIATCTAEHATSDTPCLLYTSPSPRDGLLSRMPSSA